MGKNSVNVLVQFCGRHPVNCVNVLVQCHGRENFKFYLSKLNTGYKNFPHMV